MDLLVRAWTLSQGFVFTQLERLALKIPHVQQPYGDI